MKDNSRRNFVKQTAATGLTFTFAGLIRAHGATTIVGGGGINSTNTDTTYDQWGSGDSGSSGITVDITSVDQFTIITNFTVNQWEWWSVEPVTNETLPTALCNPHTWVKSGFPVPGFDYQGNPVFTQWYRCDHCGLLHEGEPW